MFYFIKWHFNKWHGNLIRAPTRKCVKANWVQYFFSIIEVIAGVYFDFVKMEINCMHIFTLFLFYLYISRTAIVRRFKLRQTTTVFKFPSKNTYHCCKFETISWTQCRGTKNVRPLHIESLFLDNVNTSNKLLGVNLLI